MKKIFIVSLFSLLVFPFSNQALADAAPATPPYPNINLTVKVGLGNLTDKYIIIRHTSKYGEYYSLVTEPYVIPGSYGSVAYFALDKNYFESNGGINGLFLTTGSNEDIVMSPKDEQTLKAHSYNFIVSKNDSLLNSEFGGPGDEAVDSQYVKFPFRSDFYTRQGPDDSNCQTGYNNGTKNCAMGEKTLTYLPQQINGNNILLVNSDTLNQNSAQTPQHISWWRKIWNFFKSLF